MRFYSHQGLRRDRLVQNADTLTPVRHVTRQQRLAALVHTDSGWRLIGVQSSAPAAKIAGVPITRHIRHRLSR